MAIRGGRLSDHRGHAVFGCNRRQVSKTGLFGCGFEQTLRQRVRCAGGAFGKMSLRIGELDAR
jgi:hypothetical protein